MGRSRAIRLCQATELAEVTVLLLQRCRPGTQLRASPPHEHDLVIAGLLRRLWTQPPPGHCFRPISDMRLLGQSLPGAEPVRTQLPRGATGDQGIWLLRALPKGGGGAVFLHTDLHAAMSSPPNASHGLAIDPRPYVGDPTYDVTQHIFNGVFIEVPTLAPSPPGWRACSISIPAGSLPGPSKRRRTGRNGRPGPDPSTPPCPEQCRRPSGSARRRPRRRHHGDHRA